MFNREKIQKLENAWKNWDALVQKEMEKTPEQPLLFETMSNIPVKRVYTPLDIQEMDYEDDIGLPGQYPYTRGIQPTMYRGRRWTMRQYAGFGTAEESNRRYRYLLEQGQTGLSVAFDLPSQIGYDSDHPLALGEVGKVGVAIDSVRDMETLLSGIPLDRVSTSMTINAPASILLSMYIDVGERQGVPGERLNGTVQNDILKEYVARGTYIFPPGASMRITTDIFSFCAKRVPRWNTISISGYHMREAGCTAVQEVAFTLANGIAYVEAALRAGLDVDAFAPRLSFFFNAHLDFLEEVAKYRAARRLWARIMKERFRAKNPRSLMIRFHTQTGGSTLTAQQPLNNVVRVAIQALSAVLGGTQSLHTNSYDEALALPSEQSVQIALRTQQIIAYESGAANTVDPLAGSFYIERLTNDIEEMAHDYISKIDDIGGTLAAIERGYIQKEIQEAAYRYQKDVETNRRTVVGLNQFTQEEAPPKGLLRVNPAVREQQIKKLEVLHKERDNEAVSRRLDAVRQAASGSENLMPRILDAVHSETTLGEICNAMRDVFGEYKPDYKL